MPRITQLLLIPAFLVLAAPAQNAPSFTRAFELKPSEGVFAYSRISPDGKLLAYASETANPRGMGITRTVVVVDLAQKKPIFSEEGIDAYWSNDNSRMIYLASTSRGSDVSIRNQQSGAITRSVAPVGLGDYFSWAVRDGRNLILTIQSNYYYLDGNKAVLPHSRVTSCPGIGVGERPLISHDGRRITTFVRGTIVVRGLDNCDNIIDTGLPGAKADFSFDGRYVAFHIPREGRAGYDIGVVDLRDKTVRRVTASLTGNSYFPNWTQDGRISFRYDGPDFKGFMFVSNPLSAPARPLPTVPAHLPEERKWSDIFPETSLPTSRMSVVFVWGAWGAHSPEALTALQRASDFFHDASIDVSVLMTTDPGSHEEDVSRLVSAQRVSVPRIPLAPERLRLSELNNQNPATLLFRDGVVVDRRLGAQTFEELRDWVTSVAAGG